MEYEFSSSNLEIYNTHLLEKEIFNLELCNYQYTYGKTQKYYKYMKVQEIQEILRNTTHVLCGIYCICNILRFVHRYFDNCITPKRKSLFLEDVYCKSPNLNLEIQIPILWEFSVICIFDNAVTISSLLGSKGLMFSSIADFKDVL